MRMMPISLSAGLVFLALLVVAPVRAATGPDAARIARAGNGHGAASCASCHGAHGGGNAAAGYPRLAGLNPAYLLKQLDNFAHGSRVNAVMQPMAKALSPAERKAMADYYGAMPIPAAARHGAAKPPPADSLGARLAHWGRWSKRMPACVTCHGPHGVGVGKHFPPLAGQSAHYIANQLRAWQKGTRHNDPLKLMQHVASTLSAKDIQAVAAWFAAQPATLEGDAR